LFLFVWNKGSEWGWIKEACHQRLREYLVASQAESRARGWALALVEFGDSFENRVGQAHIDAAAITVWLVILVAANECLLVRTAWRLQTQGILRRGFHAVVAGQLP